MNGYERFMSALKRQEPDAVPIWELIIDKPVIKGLYGEISFLDFIERENLDGFTIFEDWTKLLRKLNESNTYIDKWNITWKMEPNGILYPLDGPIKDYKDLKNYSLPDADLECWYVSLKEAVKRFKGEKAIVFMAHDAFEYSHYLFGGMDKLFTNYFLAPDIVKEVAEMVWRYKSKSIKNAIEVGADAIVLGDDYAGRTGTLMSPEHFREFVLPYLKKAVDITHKNGSYLIKHTDGNIWKILDDIVGTGIDAIDPMEPIADMDAGKVKEKYGDRVCLIGNIDCAMLLPMGTKVEVEEAVKETIAKATPGGGYIMASSNSIHPGVKPENYRTMVEATRRYGRYPIDVNLVKEYKVKNYIKKFV